ncbi:MAG: hypothetical protein LH613_18795 [Chamaesiphon sp.]|nr:hypothetical protein [Chamaesiphon sp.]
MPKIKFASDNSQAYDKTQIQLKVLPGVRERLRSIPKWQDKLRAAIDELIAQNLDQ